LAPQVTAVVDTFRNAYTEQGVAMLSSVLMAPATKS
jgi:hypothetical protein